MTRVMLYSARVLAKVAIITIVSFLTIYRNFEEIKKRELELIPRYSWAFDKQGTLTERREECSSHVKVMYPEVLSYLDNNQTSSHLAVRREEQRTSS